MSKLQAALEWAARGFRVFPLHPNGKTPAFGSTWFDIATSDPAYITAWWRDPLGTERDYNIGVDCTGMCVIDVDVKEGKQGDVEYDLLGGTYDTLVVQTPTGGFHCYFTSEDFSNAPLSRAVDVRSHHGYVVAPGSTIDGVAYVLSRDAPMSPLPEQIRTALRSPYVRTSQQIVLDSDSAIQSAINFLEAAPPAIEGSRGDDTTFQTAARVVNEFALSETVALQLLWDHYNPRCIPEWGLDELAEKVRNAKAYGTATSGRQNPSLVYAGVEITPPSMIHAVAWGNGLGAEELPPRPWLVDRVLMTGEVTAVVAPGSAGKSSWALAVAAHLAVGQDFAGETTHKAVRSLVYNGEDDVIEQSRRLYAACTVHGIDYNYARSQITMWSDADADIKVATSEGRGVAKPVTGMVDQLVQMCREHEIGLLVLDPLVDVHACNEDSNVEMNVVMRTLRRIAHEANVAVLVLHHTTKGGNQRQEERIGNMDISRGASGIIYKTRISFTLLNATMSDCENFGIQETERHTYVRMDDAKMNLALADGKPTWYKRQGVKLANGDMVGALEPVQLQHNEHMLTERVAKLLMDTMEVNNQGSMAMKQAIAVVKTREPIMANRKDVEVRARLEGLFSVPFVLANRTLTVVRDPDNDKAQPVITLT